MIETYVFGVMSLLVLILIFGGRILKDAILTYIGAIISFLLGLDIYIGNGVVGAGSVLNVTLPIVLWGLALYILFGGSIESFEKFATTPKQNKKQR